MTDTRQQVADVLFTAAILGVGLLSGNPILENARIEDVLANGFWSGMVIE